MLAKLTAPLLLFFAAQAAAAAPVDLTALRYYASVGQKDRVAAETRRLQRLEPGFQPPDDLFTARPGRADEEPLWTLFKQGRLDDIDAAIALRRKADPGWQPSEDLVAKTKLRRLRATMMDLSAKGEWRAVLRSLTTTGIAWAKDDAQLLWVIGEAYAREKNTSEAYVVYRLILANHDEAAERRATIEYAIALLPMALTEKLIAMGRKDAAGRSEFEPIAIDITRARISAFLHDEPANEVTDDELRRFQDAVRGAADPNEPALVAWYAFKRRDNPQALDWFKLAISHGGDAMVAHGLAHTLRKLGLKREAEEVAYAWREPLVNNSILFIDLLEEDLTKERPPAIEPARLARYGQVTTSTESGEGAQALAWYAYNTCQYPLALQWFERAVAWLPKEATAYGYALALQRTHHAKEFRDVVNRYDGLFPKVVALAFDDGIRKSSPCDEQARNKTAAPREMVQVGLPVDWSGRTMADTLRPQAVPNVQVRPSVAFGAGRVPSPDALGAGVASLKKKIEFPVSVPPENPLRFSALRTVVTESEDQGRLRERLEAGWPLVARRVPGVGPMPYESFGFQLLPGYDGTREASVPTAAERNAPAGTLWALEQSLRGTATTQWQPASPDILSRRPVVKAGSATLANPDRRT